MRLGSYPLQRYGSAKAAEGWRPMELTEVAIVLYPGRGTRRRGVVAAGAAIRRIAWPHPGQLQCRLGRRPDGKLTWIAIKVRTAGALAPDRDAI